MTSPLKADKFQSDPCSVFTPEQLREYGVGPGAVTTDEAGKVCSWETNDEGGIDLGWDDLIGTGLSRVYKGHKNGKYAFFDVLPDIEGLPAVSYDQKDQRKQGICTVSVGVSDQLSFMVSIAQSASKQGTRPPCEVAATVAADAVRSMKAGG